jgi:hypothetical protein
MNYIYKVMLGILLASLDTMKDYLKYLIRKIYE